jgi:hypothetical protein
MATGNLTVSELAVYQNSYEEMFSEELQQKQSRLMRTVQLFNKTADKNYYDRIEKITVRKKTGSHEKVISDPASYQRRFYEYDTYYSDIVVDKDDMLRMANEPGNAIVGQMRQAMAREHDAEIIRSFFADVKTGDDGSTVATFPSANQVAVDFAFGGGGSNSNLGVDKLLKGIETLQANEAMDPSEPLYCGITAAMERALKRDSDFKDFDFNNSKPLTMRGLPEWQGIQFIRCEFLETDDNGYVRCPLYTPKAMRFNAPTLENLRLREDPDYHFNPHFYIASRFGGNRQYENAIVEIKCDITV